MALPALHIGRCWDSAPWAQFPCTRGSRGFVHRSLQPRHVQNCISRSPHPSFPRRLVPQTRSDSRRACTEREIRCPIRSKEKRPRSRFIKLPPRRFHALNRGAHFKFLHPLLCRSRTFASISKNNPNLSVNSVPRMNRTRPQARYPQPYTTSPNIPNTNPPHAQKSSPS